mgnify:CR=1 FL=1
MMYRTLVRQVTLALASVLLMAACDPGAGERRGSPAADTTGAAARAVDARREAIADSVKDGHHVYKDKAGRPLMEGEMRNGQRNGVWTSYLPNGRVQSRNVYEQGVLHGMSTVFHDNGVLYYSGAQRRGKPFGEWKFYDDHGVLARTVIYDSTGTMIGPGDKSSQRPH